MPFEVRIDPSYSSELREKALRTRDVVRDVLGQSADLVKAEWDATIEQGPAGPRPVLLLKLTDPFSGTTQERFAPQELDSDSHLWWRIYHAWGRLLRDRSHAQMKRLDALAQDLVTDGSGPA